MDTRTRTVRFDLTYPHKQHDTEVRLRARKFITTQGDSPVEVNIKRVYKDDDGWKYGIVATVT